MRVRGVREGAEGVGEGQLRRGPEPRRDGEERRHREAVRRRDVDDVLAETADASVSPITPSDVDDAFATTFALAKSVEVAVPRGRRDDEDAIARALDDDANAIVGTHFEAEMSIADALDPHFVHEHVRRWTAAKTKTRDAGATFGLTTIDAEVDSDDCFCVTPKGRFVASLMADAKESLGMQTTEDARGKALASVNLTREEFKVGNWFHDRIGACARAFEQRTGKSKVLCAYMVSGAHEEVKFPRTVTAARRAESVKTSSQASAIMPMIMI